MAPAGWLVTARYKAMSSIWLIMLLDNDVDCIIRLITATAFYPVSDLIWSGDYASFVVALHGLHSTSFPVGNVVPVNQIAVLDNHVSTLGLAGHGVGGWAKGGMNEWYFRATSATVSVISPAVFLSGLVAATITPDFVPLTAVTSANLHQNLSLHLAHLAFSLHLALHVS